MGMFSFRKMCVEKGGKIFLLWIKNVINQYQKLQFQSDVYNTCQVTYGLKIVILVIN